MRRTEITPFVSTVQEGNPAWSLDDQTIYFHRYSAATGDYDIYSAPASGGSAVAHYATAVRETYPVVTLGGGKLAFSHQFTPGIYNAGLSAVEDPYNVLQLTYRDQNTSITDFHADDRRILFVSRNDPDNLELFELDTFSGIERQLTHDSTPWYDPGTHFAVYSPTSDLIAFSSRREGTDNNIWILDYAGLSGVPDGGIGVTALNLAARPNPMTALTTITLDLPAPAPVGVRIFDVRGAVVRTLLPETSLAAGPLAWGWDGRDDAGRALTAATYFVQVTAGVRATTRKVQIVR